MTRNGGFDRALSAFLHEEAEWTTPDYLGEILAETVRTRQRPAWSSLERWLPVQSTLRFIQVPRLAWLLVVLALLVALASAALFVGSRPRLPEPFGLAGNGAIAYGAGDGDLYTLDATTGASTLLIGGATRDETPDFSHDGSRFVFARESDIPDRWLVMVADADGGNARALSGPIYPEWIVWSADDTQVAVVDSAASPPTLSIYHLDGSPPTILDIDGLHPAAAAFRPDGREIVFLGAKPGSYGLYAVATDGRTAMRGIVPPIATQSHLTFPRLSPDGQTLAYTLWELGHSVIHLVDVDTGADRAIRLDPSSTGENWAEWSPDGTRLLFHRHGIDTYRLAVAPVSGGPAVLIGPTFPEGTGGAAAAFSPDGSKVIAHYDSDGSNWLLDANGGPGTLLGVDSSNALSWQRRAP